MAMCDTCASPHEAVGRRSSLSVLSIVIIVLVGPLLLLQPFGSAGKPKTGQGPNRADRVFVRDLAEQARRGIELGEELVNRASDPRARVGAGRFLTQERIDRRAAVAAGGDAAGPTSRSVTPGGGSLLRAAARHTREDLLLARIELTSGRSPRLRQLARRIAAREPTALPSGGDPG
jgi:hypothetical protein